MLVMLVGLALVVNLGLIVWLARIESRLKKFLRGRDARNLEELIVRLGEEVERVNQVNEQIKNHLMSMEKRLQRSVQHVRTVRFNPFPNAGGRQSFSSAWLDEKGNGTVISGLYARDQMMVYAKPVAGYQSEHELSDEEREAIARA